MAGVTGRDARIAFIKAATWGTAASVTKGVYFQSTGGLKLQPARVNDDAFGQAFLGAGDLGDVTAPNLTWTGRSRYDDHNYILDALAMGSPAAATLSNSAAGQVASYSHIIDLAPSIDGLFATFAVDKVLFVDELPSAKVFGFSEMVGDGGVMDRAYKILGSKPNEVSTTNTRSTVNGATFPALSNRVFRNHGTFRMNMQGASALASGDAIKIETFEFTFERPQDAPFVFSQDYVMEPADNGFPTIQVKLTYPRMNTVSANSLYAALRVSGQKFKADLTFLGAFINSTDRYTRLYQFPHLELDDHASEIASAQQAKPTAVLTAKMAASSPAGLPFVNPFRVSLINTATAAAF